MSSITIERDQSIENLQKQFNHIFPYLKIEFFSEPHAIGQLSNKNKIIDKSKRISSIQPQPHAGILEMNPDITVAELEQQFQKIYGLYVQVFRKSGSIWLETSVTDHWTLERQNEEGRTLHEHFKEINGNSEEQDMD